MNTRNMTILMMAAGLTLPFAVEASAQSMEEVEEAEEQPATNFPQEELPRSQSDNDAAPPVASPMSPQTGVIKQAGVGGEMAYGRAGVLELGGSAGLVAGDNYTQVDFTPSIGYFIADNLQVSAMIGAGYIKTGDNDATRFQVLLEPSYHMPFSNSVFGFLGVGAGLAYVEGPGAGLAIAPRVGANIMVGRSGVLSPYLSYSYTTHDTTEVGENMQLLAVSAAVAANVGYTVMW